MLTEQLDERLVRCVAPNGLRVLTEVLPGVRSAAVGIWVRSASVHESADRMGVSHLLEHMVFKGTERRNPYQIALELESRGGSLDAFTSTAPAEVAIFSRSDGSKVCRSTTASRAAAREDSSSSVCGRRQSLRNGSLVMLVVASQVMRPSHRA